MPRTSSETGAANGSSAAAAAASHAKARVVGPEAGEAPELRDLLQALQAVRVGDFSVRMAGHQLGLLGKVADTFNDDLAKRGSTIRFDLARVDD